MPRFEFRKQALKAASVDAVAVFVGKSEGAALLGAEGAALDHDLGFDIAAELEGGRMTGDLGSVARIPTRGAIKAKVVLVVGLGEEPDVHALRKAAGSAARNAAKDSSLAVVVPGDLLAGEVEDAERAQAVTEGVGLGAYAFTAYRSKTNDAPSLGDVTVMAGEGLKPADVKAGMELGKILVEATCLARDLVNEPPAGKRPPDLADRVAGLAKQFGLKVKVLDEKALAKGQFGGILGVGQGSSVGPRLVELTHDPARAKGHVVLVGKGITFDSGGLSLKPTTGMATMKSDMSGAASVVGVLAAAARLGVKVKVTGLLALAENMPSGDAIRVSDVLTHRNGKTVEVMNTDAEGRLVLADALAYGAESKPDALIDLATLTGAQVSALGHKISAIMGSDDALVAALQTAAGQTGEAVWRMPLPAEYREHLDSPVADLKNIGRPGQAGTSVAGLFLSEFTADAPWAHFDIAGPAFDENGDGFLNAKGGTGVCVRLLTRYLQDLA